MWVAVGGSWKTTSEMTIRRMIKPYCFMRNHFNKYIPLWSSLPWCLVTLVVYSMEDWGLQFHSLVPLVLSDNWSTHRFLKQQKSRHFEGSAPQSLKWVHWLQWMVWSSHFYHGSSFESEMGKAACQSQKHQTWKMARLKAKHPDSVAWTTLLQSERLYAKSAWRKCKSPRQHSACGTQKSWHLFDPIIFSDICIWINLSFVCPFLHMSPLVFHGLSVSLLPHLHVELLYVMGVAFECFWNAAFASPWCYMKSVQMSPVVSLFAVTLLWHHKEESFFYSNKFTHPFHAKRLGPNQWFQRGRCDNKNQPIDNRQVNRLHREPGRFPSTVTFGTTNPYRCKLQEELKPMTLLMWQTLDAAMLLFSSPQLLGRDLQDCCKQTANLGSRTLWSEIARFFQFPSLVIPNFMLTFCPTSTKKNIRTPNGRRYTNATQYQRHPKTYLVVRVRGVILHEDIWRNTN